MGGAAPLTRAAKVLTWVTLGVVAIAAFSGLVLVWWYQPGGVWSDASAGIDALVAVHALSMQGAVMLAGATTLVLVAGRESVVRSVASGAVVVSAAVASMTWGLIVWDQIAFDAVRVGSDVRGLWRPAYDEGVAFLLIDGAEIGQKTYRRWLLIHLGSLAAMVLASLATAWPARRTAGDDEVERDADGIPLFDLR